MLMLERTTPSKLFSSSCQIVEARNPKEAAELKEQDKKGDEEAQNSGGSGVGAPAHFFACFAAPNADSTPRLDSTRLELIRPKVTCS